MTRRSLTTLSSRYFPELPRQAFALLYPQVQLQDQFEHIQDVTKTGTNNRLYESWGNRIDIRELLKTGDLECGPLVISLVNSDIIDQIATYTLTSKRPLSKPRPYVSSGLTLFLSLTNLRGTPYALNGVAPGSVEENDFFYGDRIRFQLASDNQPHARPTHWLDANKTGAAGGWDILAAATKATGSFPIVLAPWIMQRDMTEYTTADVGVRRRRCDRQPATGLSHVPARQPAFAADIKRRWRSHQQRSVQLCSRSSCKAGPAAHGYSEAPRTAINVERAVTTIAPFPTTRKFHPDYNVDAHSDIFSVLSSLVSALRSQFRLFGESLDKVMKGTTFNRFVIAPSDYELTKEHEGTGYGTSVCGTRRFRRVLRAWIQRA